MDQVRAFVRVVWTQRFWVLGALCTIVGVVCWQMATSDLNADFKKRKSAIDSVYKAVSGIKNEFTHPNDDVNEGNKRQARQQRDYVLKVWEEIYQLQKDVVLQWPASLGEDFVENMKDRKFGDSIGSKNRGIYLNYIENRFDKLLEIAEALDLGEDGRGARGRGFGGGGYGMEEYGGDFGGGQGTTVMEDEDYLVQWPEQGKLRSKLFFETKPTDLQVWVTQEDLWVYETLLNVIAKTNKARNATRPDNTAVRAIMALQVGAETATSSQTGQIYIPQAAAGSAGEYGEFGGMAEGYGGMMEEYGGEYGGGMDDYGGGMGRGYGGEGATDTQLLANRYLDAEGKPIPEATTESVAAGEFRQLPIRMQLAMDQRWIPRVLIECANAALPVEVKQLRVNPDQALSGFGTRGGRTSSSLRALKGMELDPNIATVEIRGVVYIYNQPDPNVLAVPGDDEIAAVDDSI